MHAYLVGVCSKAGAYIRRFGFVCGGGLGLLVCCASAAWAAPASNAANEEAYGQIEVLARALSYVESRAATQPSLERLVRAAIRGMLREVDSNSRHWTADELAAWEHSSELGELGLYAEAAAEGFVVFSIQEGSPAHKVGIRKNDVLLFIDEQPVQGLSAREVHSQLLGPVGSRVTLTLQRNEVLQPLRFRLTRVSSWLPPLQTFWVDSVWVVRLSRFSKGVCAELSKQLSLALKQKPTAILLDLRDNFGGLLQEAFGVAGLFLPPLSPIVQVQNPQTQYSKTEKTTPSSPLAVHLPLLVFINHGSASVTEVLAAALKDNGRARLLGEKSYGKGSIQEKLLLPDGSAIYLTVAHFVRLTGAKIDKDGVSPDCNLSKPKDCKGFDNFPPKTTRPLSNNKDEWLEWATSWLLQK